MGGEKLEIGEIGVISTLGTAVSGFAKDVRGYSYSPRLSSVSTAKNSKIADAVRDKDTLINSTRNAIAENMDEYSTLCGQAKSGYLKTEGDVKDKFENVRKV